MVAGELPVPDGEEVVAAVEEVNGFESEEMTACERSSVYWRVLSSACCWMWVETLALL